MTTLIGKYRTQYEFDGQMVKVTKPTGDIFYVPLDDMVMMIAAYKRRLINTTPDAELLGLK